VKKKLLTKMASIIFNSVWCFCLFALILKNAEVSTTTTTTATTTTTTTTTTAAATTATIRGQSGRNFELGPRFGGGYFLAPNYPSQTRFFYPGELRFLTFQPLFYPLQVSML
jgi:hypothetical protein